MGLIAKGPYLLPPWVWARTEHAQRTGIEELATGAANPQGSGRVGARVRCKMERGDRGDCKGVLTRVEDGGRRPESEVNGAVELGHLGLQVRRHSSARHGRRGASGGG
jgi:hypothetical protein